MAKKMAAKKTKVVPEAGETEYVVINPAQVEKIVTAIEGIKIDPSRLVLAFPEDFWRKFWAGCFVASGIRSSELAIEYADDLAKRFREGK